MRGTSLWVGMLLAVVGGLGGEMFGAEQPALDISNGIVTSGAGFGVVKIAIATSMGPAGCSGTLVASNWVLTARHCATSDFTPSGNTLRPPTDFTVDLNGVKRSVLAVEQDPDDIFHFSDVVLLQLNGVYPDPFRPVWGGTQEELDGQVVTGYGYAVDHVPADCPGGGEPCLGPLRAGGFTQDHGKISFDFGSQLQQGDSGGPCFYFEPVTDPITMATYCPIPCPSFLVSVHSAVDTFNKVGIETSAPNFASWLADTIGGQTWASPLWGASWNGIKLGFAPAGEFAPTFVSSKAGEAALLDGTTDIALLERPLRLPIASQADRLGIPLRAGVVGLNGIGLFVGKDVQLDHLDLPTLRMLYGGADGSGSTEACASADRPTQFAVLPGAPQDAAPIHLLRPEAGRGDLVSEFQRLVGISAFCADVREVSGRAAAGLAVALDAGAIAFDALDADNPDRNRFVPLLNAAGAPSLPDAASIRSGAYPLIRPLVVVANANPRSPEAQEFADWLFDPALVGPSLLEQGSVDCDASGCPGNVPAIVDAPDPFALRETTLLASKDTSVTSLAQKVNYGTRETLDAERALVRFDDQELREALAGRTLDRATLVLTLTDPIAPSRNPSSVTAFALSQDWAEDGATWLCSDAIVEGNLSRICPLGRSWSMGTDGSRPPWYDGAIATATLPVRSVGTVRLDVTADISTLFHGRHEYGYVLITSGRGRVHFGSRESDDPPKLVLQFR